MDKQVNMESSCYLLLFLSEILIAASIKSTNHNKTIKIFF